VQRFRREGLTPDVSSGTHGSAMLDEPLQISLAINIVRTSSMCMTDVSESVHIMQSDYTKVPLGERKLTVQVFPVR
jgi:hypothetical protein